MNFVSNYFPKESLGGGVIIYPKVITLNYHVNQIKRPARKKTKHLPNSQHDGLQRIMGNVVG